MSLLLAAATALHDEHEYPLSADSDQKFDKQRSKALNVVGDDGDNSQKDYRIWG
jgi:hypothetical protein